MIGQMGGATQQQRYLWRGLSVDESQWFMRSYDQVCLQKVYLQVMRVDKCQMDNQPPMW